MVKGKGAPEQELKSPSGWYKRMCRKKWITLCMEFWWKPQNPPRGDMCRLARSCC